MYGHPCKERMSVRIFFFFCTDTHFYIKSDNFVYCRYNIVTDTFYYLYYYYLYYKLLFFVRFFNWLQVCKTDTDTTVKHRFYCGRKCKIPKFESYIWTLSVLYVYSWCIRTIRFAIFEADIIWRSYINFTSEFISPNLISIDKTLFRSQDYLSWHSGISHEHVSRQPELSLSSGNSSISCCTGAAIIFVSTLYKYNWKKGRWFWVPVISRTFSELSVRLKIDKRIEKDNFSWSLSRNKGGGLVGRRSTEWRW